MITTPLSSDVRRDDVRPYFLWDEPTTVGELRRLLAEPAHPQRLRYLERLLREARVEDVWVFVDPGTVAALWPVLGSRMGRRRPVGEFLLKTWRRHGLLAA